MIGDNDSAKVDCAVIIVTYNSANFIGSLLDSLSESAPSYTLDVVVVDNGSGDNTVELVRERSGVRCVATGVNLGYAGGINVGREYLREFDALAILNPDLILTKNALGELLAALSDPGIGVAVPRLLNADGSFYPSLYREPSLSRAVGDTLLGHHFHQRPAFLSQVVNSPQAYDSRHSVDWASGAAMVISAACDRAVGEWDERFFLYCEETDFMSRVRAAGLRVEYVPDAVARHQGGGSGTSGALSALMAVNRIRYYRKYHSAAASLLFRVIVAGHYAVRAANPDSRSVLKTLLSRARWNALPHGDSPARREDRGQPIAS